MDATYVNPALNAIVNVLEKMAQLKLERESVMVKTHHMALSEISSIIRMEGEARYRIGRHIIST